MYIYVISIERVCVWAASFIHHSCGSVCRKTKQTVNMHVPYMTVY